MIRNKNGFTLIELLVAVSIIILVVIGSLTCFTHLMILADASINLTMAVNDAQLVLEQLKDTPYSSISSYIVPVFSNLSNETITLTRNVGPKLAIVSVNVGWLEKGQSKSYVLSTCILK